MYCTGRHIEQILQILNLKKNGRKKNLKYIRNSENLADLATSSSSKLEEIFYFSFLY